MNFTTIHEILEKYAYQFISDQFCYYTEKYDTFTNVKTLSSREKAVIVQEACDMFQEINHKITLPFYCTLMLQSIINSHTSNLLINQKHYTTNVLFVTWRPTKEMDINTFKDITIKFLEKEIIQSYIIVYEQKGTSYSTLGQGKHFHAIIQFYYKSQFKTYKQQIDKYFTDKGIYKLIPITFQQFIIDKLVYMGLITNEDFNELHLNPDLNYKKGNTEEETKEKLACLPYDRLFQQRNNLPFQAKNEKNILDLVLDFVCDNGR